MFEPICSIFIACTGEVQEEDDVEEQKEMEIKGEKKQRKERN